MPKEKKGSSVETEQPLTIACHMKNSYDNVVSSFLLFVNGLSRFCTC